MKKKIQRTRRFYREMRGKRPLGTRPDGAICSTCQAERDTATRMVVHMAVRHRRLPYGNHAPGVPMGFLTFEWNFDDGSRIVAYVPKGGRLGRRALLEVLPDGSSEVRLWTEGEY